MSTKRIEFTDLILLELIDLDPHPIRKELNQELIQELIESYTMLPMGPLDIPVVKPTSNGRYQVISGNHRISALKQGGWVDVPCHVIEPLNDKEEFLMKLHANTKRRNLSDLELCEAMAKEKEIYEQFYPEARHGGNLKENLADGPSLQFANTEKKGYTEIMAKTTGVARSTIHRDVMVGQTVQEIPELKDANASKTQVLAIAQRKPEERTLVKKALQASSNKVETLQAFTRRDNRHREESDADYAYRCIKDVHRLLEKGIHWKSLDLHKLIELHQGGILIRLSLLLEVEESQVFEAIESLE